MRLFNIFFVCLRFVKKMTKFIWNSKNIIWFIHICSFSTVKMICFPSFFLFLPTFLADPVWQPSKSSKVAAHSVSSLKVAGPKVRRPRDTREPIGVWGEMGPLSKWSVNELFHLLMNGVFVGVTISIKWVGDIFYFRQIYDKHNLKRLWCWGNGGIACLVLPCLHRIGRWCFFSNGKCSDPRLVFKWE